MDRARTVKAPAFLDRNWVSSCGLISGQQRGRLVLDLSGTERIDSAGVCFIELLGRMYHEQGGQFAVQGARPGIAKQLDGGKAARAVVTAAPPNEGLFLRLGGGLVSAVGVAVDAISMFAEMLYWSTIGLFRRQDIKKGAVYEQMYQLGYKAVGIITLLSFLIGVVLSLQSAIQLKNLGMGIFLVPLIGITMIRQMGPLLTAIILAGRTGSATTAEIATMVVGEEVDALRTMGINPMQYIMAPKFWAISLTMPLLSIIATAAGIFGGYVIALLYLDFNTSMFLKELVKVIKLEHILAGCFKSMVFSWLIIWVGCYFGFRVRGGAEAVGRETTSSVVVGIFIIIVANAVFSFIM
ncbi:MAG: MlaE family lipid ABC transporter permease subunit [Chitinispirillia bacterium]|nr:MlaE family lipid ABC transporter permease subunit [Chitinispirillia bacterium]MCL2242702.1 MlaE family lipid ABC transporter permease subunit [Chitinispirillia bacterium]